MVDVADRSLPRFQPAVGRAASAGDAAGRIAVAAFSPSWLASYRGFSRHVPHGAAQAPVWLSAWQRHASPDVATVTVRDDGAPVLMMALEVVRQGPFRIARFVGGSHASANFAAVDPHWAARAGAGDLAAIRTAVRRARPDIDCLVLSRMLEAHEGARNPFLLAGGTRSPDPALSLRLEPTIGATLKRIKDKRRAKKHRSKQRKFEEAGGFRFIRAGTAAEVTRLLDSYFRFKEAHLREAGIRNVFGDPAVQAALAATFTDALGEERPPYVLEALEVGGVLRAVAGASVSAERVTCDFIGISRDELARLSPGEFLFYCSIEAACEAGHAFFDFGIGDEPYKRHWCDVETLHADVALPLTLKGHAYAAGLAAAGGMKRRVKQNPTLWGLFKRLRRNAAGSAADDDPGEE